jgi:hypothetical protein
LLDSDSLATQNTRQHSLRMILCPPRKTRCVAEVKMKGK